MPPPASTTHVTVEIRADPKGNVPKWLVNLFQRDWPQRIARHQRQSRKPTSVKLEVKAFLDGKYGATRSQRPKSWRNIWRTPPEASRLSVR